MRLRLKGYGQTGPMAGVPLTGVTSYPFKVNEKLYYDDFAGYISNRVTHPYLTISAKSGSLPFNILSNSAEPSNTVGWETEFRRQFTKKDPDHNSGAGVRTEQQ